MKRLAGPRLLFPARPRWLQYLVVPASSDSEALRFQPCRPFGIRILPFKALSAINFNKQSFPETCEISKVRSDGSLPAKSAPQHLTVANHIPQRSFSISGVLPELPCLDNVVACLNTITRILTFLPDGGRGYLTAFQPPTGRSKSPGSAPSWGPRRTWRRAGRRRRGRGAAGRTRGGGPGPRRGGG